MRRGAGYRLKVISFLLEKAYEGEEGKEGRFLVYFYLPSRMLYLYSLLSAVGRETE
jgi:hypothetical protein